MLSHPPFWQAKPKLYCTESFTVDDPLKPVLKFPFTRAWISLCYRIFLYNDSTAGLNEGLSDINCSFFIPQIVSEHRGHSSGCYCVLGGQTCGQSDAPGLLCAQTSVRTVRECLRDSMTIMPCLRMPKRMPDQHCLICTRPQPCGGARELASTDLANGLAGPGRGKRNRGHLGEKST